MTFEYDPKADAAYLKISEKEVKDTREIVDGITLDYDSDGNVIGIEILSLKARGAGVKRSKVEVTILS